MHSDITMIIFMKMKNESQGWYYERTICFCESMILNWWDSFSACGGLDESQGCRICYKFRLDAKKSNQIKVARLVFWLVGISFWLINYSSLRRRKAQKKLFIWCLKAHNLWRNYHSKKIKDALRSDFHNEYQ